MLQEKVMEMHTKLMDQLDICKEQELLIIRLSQQAGDQSQQDFDTFNQHSFGYSSKENTAPNHPRPGQHDSTQSQAHKNELLQADLEAMRNKVLVEITQKNQLKEQMREMGGQHQREMSRMHQQCAQLQQSIAELREENQELLQRNEKMRRVKHHQESEGRVQGREEQSRGALREVQPSLLRRREQPSNDMEELKTQISKLSRTIEQQDEGMRERGEERRKRKGFEETKELIRRLEETENNMRRNRRGANH